MLIERLNMKTRVAGLVFSLSLYGCGTALPAATCTADSYPDEGFASNAAAEIELRPRLDAITEKIDEAASGMARPTAVELEALFASGSPSLRSITSESAQTEISELFTHVERAAGNTWTPTDPPTGPGGTYGKFLFTERGVDLGESVEKVVFFGAHFTQAARLMTDSATVADVDRMLALFGTSPAFPMDDKAQSNPDLFAAKYAKRRTNPSAATPGPYLAIKSAFINARAAVKGGAGCAPERADAFAAIRDQWERALLGTAIYYLNSTAATLESATPSDAQKSSALHSLTEAVGFLRGLRTVPAAHRQMTDAQLDQVLSTLGGTTLGGSDAYLYVTSSSANVDRLMAAVSQIRAARQFSSDEIALFKSNF